MYINIRDIADCNRINQIINKINKNYKTIWDKNLIVLQFFIVYNKNIYFYFYNFFVIFYRL